MLSKFRNGALMLFGVALLLASCKTSKNATQNRENEIDYQALAKALKGENAESEQPEWAPKKHSYKPSLTRYHDLIHTKLNVKFDWEKQHLIGEATLELKPFFYPTDSLTLDAKGFDLRRVALLDANGSLQNLEYHYNQSKLHIKLGRIFTREERYKIFIDYTAKPNELGAGGNMEDAITDRKGLYFINPDGKDPHRPRQIWTQGETEYSSCWFPTIDATNERTTQEIFITIEDNFKTLSNGILVASVRNADGTRTDHWKMDQPHTPYLFMMAIGEFAVVKDQWRGKEVSYYVEPKYEKHARMIFGNTPEMIEFFSKTFGVDYPWQKYSQVVVRDFVSGAMENTTATIHMEGLQHDSRQHLDETHEDYISHELTHQWFGDYVTCESWANLPLNESFASYGEHLWREYKYGSKDAEHHYTNDLVMYLMESSSKREPLIRYHYNDPQDMFDRHSYQKGACVLHMLRHVVGDDAFRASLQYYLKTHAFSPVEIDELRMAFEDVTGQDLHWFFDQWFMQPGHPELEIDYQYSNIEQKVTVNVRQTQETKIQPVFRLPTKIQIDHDGGNTSYHPVVFHTTDTVFSFPASTAPLNVVFDSEMILVSRQVEEKPVDYWIHQARKGKNFRQQQIALVYLDDQKQDPRVLNVYKECLRDEFWGVREMALNGLSASEQAFDPENLALVKTITTGDPIAAVRAAGVNYLSNTDKEALFPQIAEIYEETIRDSSYNVLASTLQAYYLINPKRALEHAKANKNIDSENVIAIVAQILLAEKEPEARTFIRTALIKTTDAMGKLSLMREMADFLENSPPEEADFDLLKDLAQNDQAWYIRFMAVRILNNFRETRPDVEGLIQELKTREKNPRLKEMYGKNF